MLATKTSYDLSDTGTIIETRPSRTRTRLREWPRTHLALGFSVAVTGAIGLAAFAGHMLGRTLLPPAPETYIRIWFVVSCMTFVVLRHVVSRLRGFAALWSAAEKRRMRSGDQLAAIRQELQVRTELARRVAASLDSQHVMLQSVLAGLGGIRAVAVEAAAVRDAMQQATATVEAIPGAVAELVRGEIREAAEQIYAAGYVDGAARQNGHIRPVN